MHRAFRLYTLVFLFTLSTAGFAQDFSADIVDLRPSHPETTTAKVFVGGSKLRMEPQGKDDKEQQVMIWDTAEHKTYVLVPERHMYLELGSNMMQQAFAFWRPADVENACPDWEKLAGQVTSGEKLRNCRKVGTEMLNGRSAVKYEGTSSDGKTGQVWLDLKLHYLFKVANSDEGGMEFRNIQEGPQPANLFEIPSGYQKMDMGKMMHQPSPPRH
jgi:hypothetical protein